MPPWEPMGRLEGAYRPIWLEMIQGGPWAIKHAIFTISLCPSYMLQNCNASSLPTVPDGSSSPIFILRFNVSVTRYHDLLVK